MHSYCTKEQTKKALGLGAPIEVVGNPDGRPFVQHGFAFAIIPTADQMIGWLEEQGVYFHLDTFGSAVEIGSDFNCIYEELCMPRKEATLAAIDAALEYLTNNKM